MISDLPHIRRYAGGLVILLAMSALLAACGPSASTTPPTPSPTPTAADKPTATPTPRVLFQADWAHGLAGWQATGGWSVSQGVLISDGGLNRDFTIPFRPAGPDYTIEFEMRIVSVPRDGEGKFFFEAPATPGQDGYISGGYHLLSHSVSNTYNHPLFGVTIDPPSSNQTLTLAPFMDYEHRFIEHTYRIEVRGSHASLLSDYHLTSAARSISTPTLSTGPLRFTCSYVVLRLSALRILSA